jgi:fucokinase
MSTHPQESGSLALLQQGYRNNWHEYLASLDGAGPAALGWDVCVLTASNRRQAEAYEAQLEARRAAGLLPRGTEFLVMPDPDGLRIGSGGATLRVLEALACRANAGAGAAPCGDGIAAFASRRVLIIHSGGDSRRLPHCSAVGKLFARVPHELPDGRASSLFDEFLVSLSGLPGQAPAGVLVASGDVLLLFDHLALSFRRPGVIGVAAAAPAEEGTRHGVYVTEMGSRRVGAFLHKPSLERLRAAGAIDAAGRVPIDTGLVWLDPAAAARLLELGEAAGEETLRGATLNLYGDLLAPLAAATERDEYLADASDGPATPTLRRIRECAWDLLRGTTFSVESLHPAEFIHFGATREYLAVLADGLRTLGGCGWSAQAASWLPPRGNGNGGDGGPLLANAYLASAAGAGDACLTDSCLTAPATLGAGSLLANVVSDAEDLQVGDGVVVHQLPLAGEGGYVTRLYGADDDPKRPLHEGGTFLNAPWPEWLARAGLTPRDLWPATTHPAECTLWDARLYPVSADREESLRAVLWLQRPEAASREAVAAWRAAERLSLGESFLRADVRRIVREAGEIEDRVRARRFCAAVEREQPARESGGMLGAPTASRARAAADHLEASIDPWLPIRGYEALALATGDDRWSTRAFSALARLVRAHTPVPEEDAAALAGLAPGRSVTMRAAARLDFGGGWSDTPPYSLERGGVVLNGAIRLRGELPILARAEVIDEPALVLESQDIEATIRPRCLGEVLDYANPADPFALCKAALVFRGLVPRGVDPDLPVADMLGPLGKGLFLRTATSIPRGSGLGTSSILAGAVLQALAALLGERVAEARLFDEVLCLEQMITTGGGWQDQIGGLTGGIKLIRTRPGLPQAARLEPVALTPTLARGLEERLLLVYTGQRRLAKNLLRAVMGRWMARDPEMVAMLAEIAALAEAMRDALVAEDLDAFGDLIARHWEINKRMDPGCSNPFIDDLLALCAPYIVGAKLAGAGGGGFALMVARDGAAARELGDVLGRRFRDGEAGLWPCAIAAPGLASGEGA